MTAQWEIEEHTPNGDYVLHCEFEDGPDVFIAINQVDNVFQIEITAAETNGKEFEQVKGPFQTFEVALDLAQAECKSWDAGRRI